MRNTIFITGTDTDVGKTAVSAWACQAWDADYWKPVQAGLEPTTDTETVMRLGGLSRSRVHPSTYELTAPMSPHAAAAIDGVTIALDDFERPQTNRPLVVEGAGGVLVPLNDRDLMVDLVKHLDIPVIVVARSGLGTINHTLLTLEALRTRHVPIAGVVTVGEPHASNRAALEHFGRVAVIAEIPKVERVTPEAVANFPRPPLFDHVLARTRL